MPGDWAERDLIQYLLCNDEVELFGVSDGTVGSLSVLQVRKLSEQALRLPDEGNRELSDERFPDVHLDVDESDSGLWAQTPAEGPELREGSRPHYQYGTRG